MFTLCWGLCVGLLCPWRWGSSGGTYKSRSPFRSPGQNRDLDTHWVQLGSRAEDVGLHMEPRIQWETTDLYFPLVWNASANIFTGEGNDTPLQYSCLENPMDGGAWKAAVHGVAEGRTLLRDFTFTFHFHALEKEMATHSSVLALRIPGTGEPGGLLSIGLHRVGQTEVT